MKAALLALVAAPVATIPTTQFYDGMPPARFMYPMHETKVVFGRVDKCGNASSSQNPNAYFESCVRHGVTYLPDPCAYGNTEVFARLTCHELAHQNGWPADHGE